MAGRTQTTSPRSSRRAVEKDGEGWGTGTKTDAPQGGVSKGRRTRQGRTTGSDSRPRQPGPVTPPSPSRTYGEAVRMEGRTAREGTPPKTIWEVRSWDREGVLTPRTTGPRGRPILRPSPELNTLTKFCPFFSLFPILLVTPPPC